jgi:SAM-dependent methyltransferase
MPKTEPFDRHGADYDAWFDSHQWAFLSEVEALRGFLPTQGEVLEVGVGTGRFAQALGVRWGVDPSPVMRAWSHWRGIRAFDGAGEALPFENERFSAVLMVTTICFLDDVDQALLESHRVLKRDGVFVTGFIEAKSDLGRLYQEQQGESRFYGEARFWSAPDLVSAVMRAGFAPPRIAQTLFHPPNSLRQIEPTKPGFGEGSFVVFAAEKVQESGGSV